MNQRIKKKLANCCGFKTWSGFRYHKISQLAFEYKESANSGMMFTIITACKKDKGRFKRIHSVKLLQNCVPTSCASTMSSLDIEFKPPAYLSNNPCISKMANMLMSNGYSIANTDRIIENMCEESD